VLGTSIINQSWQDQIPLSRHKINATEFTNTNQSELSRKTLKPVSVAKDLGMHLDLHLSYDDHISKLSSTCINKLCQISRVKESFDKKTLILLIETLVIIKLLYSSSVWANTSSKNLKKLQTVQNFACRIITSIKKSDHVTPGLQELNWLSIENLLIYKDTIMAYKYLNNLRQVTLQINSQSDLIFIIARLEITTV
jgi:hypothetical protein